MFFSILATWCALKGKYIVSVDSKPTISVNDVLACFQQLQANTTKSFDIAFAPEQGLSAHDQGCVDEEHQQFSVESVEAKITDVKSADCDYDDIRNIPSISVADLCDIRSIRYPDLDFSEGYIPAEFIDIVLGISVIQ